MRPWIRPAAAIGLALLALAFPGGCGPKNTLPTPDEAEESRLREVGEVLRDYQLVNNRAPKSVKELQAASGSSPGGYELIRTGEVVVGWGATLPDTKEEPGASPSDKVLAYAKKVPQEGGPVLMLDRTVRRMTADEFKAAPRAGTTK